MKKTTAVISVLLCLILLLTSGCSKNAVSKIHDDGTIDVATRGDLKTDLVLGLTSGNQATFGDFKGKKVIVNFWTISCTDIKENLDALQKIQDEKKDDVVIIAINCGESTENIEHFLEHNKYTFEIAVDTTKAACDFFGEINTFPANFIIDENGEITYAKVGVTNCDKMYNELTNALNK